MNRLESRLEALRQTGRKALVTFITAGDPAPGVTVPAMRALVEGGADVLELGIPFSDPEAEGPVIQAAAERGLASGTTLRVVLDLVEHFRLSDDSTPVVLMGYLNSILAMGCQTFAERAQRSGVDGLIMVNLPPEEAEELRLALDSVSISMILLVSPTTTEARAQYITRAARGFVYYVSLKGTTGSANLDPIAAGARLRWLRQLTSLPVMCGFGIRDAASARAMAAHADGVVVGSALVATVAELGARPEAIPDALRAQVAEIRGGLDQAQEHA